MTNLWHTRPAHEVATALASDMEAGLDVFEAARRLTADGPNVLIESHSPGAWRMLREQLASSMVVLLAVAVVVSSWIGDLHDAVAIAAILVLNVALGFFQDYRAEKALDALKRMAVSTVKVRRSGRTQELSARELVRGDVLLLEAGGKVPADGRLLEAASLKVMEASLTGESAPAEKTTGPLHGAELPLGDRVNMVYMGTEIAAGRGLAVITETGMSTELGRIAESISSMEREPTPLQRRLEQLSRTLAIVAVVIAAAFFLLGLLRGESFRLMFMIAVSMAVAAVPEGLPAVATLVLAVAAQRMFKRHALIRRLAAVETLGSVTVICSDKTGTLTENRMTVTTLDVDGRRVDLAAEGHAIAAEHPALALLLTAGTLCNDASLEDASDATGRPRAMGDPTEVALVVAAAAFGLPKPELDKIFPRIREIPFSSERKRMITVHSLAPGTLPETLRDVLPAGTTRAVFAKGSVDQLLTICSGAWLEGRAEPMTEPLRLRILQADDDLARRGLRVLGGAFRFSAGEAGESDPDHDLIFIGMAGLIDPPRPEAAAAVKTCRAAGIRPIMITGDHPLTAANIARGLGISDGDRVLTGQELARMSVAELEGVVEEVSVYARVSPEHKLKIVTALKNQGHIVAMTGDGVNDAPALKKADIGVAMGIAGTDVAKEAAAMVLLDDDFATIVEAVREGRVVYDNILKFIKFLMATNSGELWLMLLAPIFGMPLPLLPLQILWVNLATDGLPALALGLEPAEGGVMDRPPRGPRERLLGREMAPHILWVGLLMAALCLGVGWYHWRAAHPAWRTIVLSTLVFSQMFHVMAIRSERQSLFRMGILTNPALLWAAGLTVLSQLAVVYVPPLQRALGTKSLSAGELVVCVLLSSLVFWVVELEKWFKRRS